MANLNGHELNEILPIECLIKLFDDKILTILEIIQKVPGILCK